MGIFKNSIVSAAALVGLLQLPLASAQLPEFTELVEQASPAVVNISTRQLDKAPSVADLQAIPGMPDLDGLPPIFRDFIERGLIQGPQGQRPRRHESQSLGSGFIISEDGYVLTNNHVVEGADEIVVRLSDRSELTARLVGADPRTDVALLKVDGDDLPSVKLGRSEEAKVGEWVVAIGSPFGFDHSVTAGIISAKGRSLPNENYVPFIQTDVAINPGNSGGPLFNLEGEVIGINSQIFTRSGGFMGLSFAIPIEVAMNVADQLKSGGSVQRGWLGVVIQEVNRDLAESFGLDKPSGALVAQVVEDSPAEKAGLEVGDVILALDGKPVEVSGDLPHLVGNLKPGVKVMLDVIRNGERRKVRLQIGTLPDGNPLVAEDTAASSNNRLGLAVAALTAEQKRELDVSAGVVVSRVEQGSMAARMGLRPGDVITHLDNKAIGSPAAFDKAARALPQGRSISMRVLRGGRASFITFRLLD